MRAARLGALQREVFAADRIGCVLQVAPHVAKSGHGDYLQVLQLGGASFESADDEQLNNWHERLNVLWRNIAAPHVALWTHVIRRRQPLAIPEAGAGGFADRLAVRYAQRLAGESLMVNELFLSIVYRPAAGVAASVFSRALTGVKDEPQLDLADSLDACEKLRQTVSASLSRYDPQSLGTYRHGGRWHSSLLEFLALLVNGEWRRIPLPAGPVNQALATTRLFFGTEAIEYRAPDSTRVGAMLGIKEYPTPTVVGMLDRLLSAPFGFVLTQSFTFLAKQTSQGLLQRQHHRMLNAGDFAVSQAEGLKAALDALTSNEFVMGDHHFSLQVLCEVAETEHGRPTTLLGRLNECVAYARALLADTGMTVAREDLALEAAFWAQLPGQFALRPRKAPISSRNLAALMPFHNYPAGRAVGNHWGPALAVLMTSARSPYHFSLHASDPADREGTGPRDTGHTLICGPTGSGKTVLIGFLIAMLERRGTTQVVFDKDRGLEILVRALGGEYLPLRNGEPTGFNPLQLADSAENVEFLKVWLRTLVRAADGRAPSVREQSDLDRALRGTLALDRDRRRLSRLLEFLDPTDPEGVHARLLRWCEVSRGEYAWLFDNSEDSIVSRISARPIVGFDVTDFLSHELARTPVTLYLFHLVRQLLDGRRLVCWMDEFWRLLADPAFEEFAKDAPKTWRKLNGVLCLATQSISDVLDSPISRTILEQTPTKVLFPNPNASATDHRTGFGMTEREFKLVKEQLEPGARSFLLKQGPQSVVCQLDLRGFAGELAVISGRKSELQRMERIMHARGPEPSSWLPEFMNESGQDVREITMEARPAAGPLAWDTAAADSQETNSAATSAGPA